jgi:hypothetical protein
MSAKTLGRRIDANVQPIGERLDRVGQLSARDGRLCSAPALVIKAIAATVTLAINARTLCHSCRLALILSGGLPRSDATMDALSGDAPPERLLIPGRHGQRAQQPFGLLRQGVLDQHGGFGTLRSEMSV